MGSRLLILCLMIALFSCSEKPGYHDYADLDRYWLNTDTIRFKVPVHDTVSAYAVWMEIRCSSEYDWSRFFSGYEIRDSVGHQLDSGLVNAMLFDPVSGEPKGKGGIGDLYELQVMIKEHYKFPHQGMYTVLFWQMMRMDSLRGIPNVGLRVEPEKASAQ